MIDPKLRKAIEAALDAADAMYREVEEPTGNMLQQWALFKEQHKAVKAARRALAKLP